MTGAPQGWPAPLRALCALLGGGDAPALGEAEWRDLVDLAVQRHRVAPVLARAMTGTDMPDAAREALKAEAVLNAHGALLQMAELKRITARFAALDVTPVVLKGWPLAEQVYGGAGHRHARDLDLYIPETAIEDCCAAMAGMGYRPDPDHRLRARILSSAALRQECNDMAFVHGQTGLPVELHWRCHHFRAWPEMLGQEGARHAVEIGGQSVLVPTDRVNMVYLSIHGSMHLWARLKWLVDIARLADLRGEAALEADLDFARQVGGFSCVALGLRLSARLLGSPLPASIEQVPAALVLIERNVLDSIANPEAAPATLRYRLDFYRTALRLSDGLPQKLGVLRYGTWRRARLLLADLLHGDRTAGARG